MSVERSVLEQTPQAVAPGRGESDEAVDVGRVLVLSWGLPPVISGVATVMGNLAKQFNRGEMLLAGERPGAMSGFDWDPQRPEIRPVVRAWPKRWKGRRLWRPLSFPLLLWGAWREARKMRCTAVLAVFPHEQYLLAGYLIARLTGAKLYPYFHNTYAENRRGTERRFAQWLQNRLFERAEHVFVMSEGMEQLYKERYPGLRCSALVHSFSEPPPQYEAPPAPGSPVRFAVCGHIWDACLDATERVCEAIGRLSDARLTFYCGNPEVLGDNGLGLLREGVITGETAPHGKVIESLQTADFVVLPHGFTGGLAPEEYATIFPTRTIEYLLCGRPILAHSPSDSFLTRFLKKHGCALVVEDPSAEAILEAIARLRADAELRAELVRRALATSWMFYGPRVAQHLRSVLAAGRR